MRARDTKTTKPVPNISKQALIIFGNYIELDPMETIYRLV